MQYVRNINRAIEWAKFFDKNKIKGILNHGASLDKNAFDIVNKSDYLKIAIGPDKIACVDSNRLFFDCSSDYKKYLQYIKRNLDVSKIVYDADYNWNLLNSDDIDYNSTLRVEEVFDGYDTKRVLGQNLLEFNSKILKKIKEKS
jgi:uncharacterized pyridoxamine 5'-phosphate oxidase family protein